MKKFALLLSTMTLASSAFAVKPEVNATLANSVKTTVEPVQLSAEKTSFGKMVAPNSFVKAQRVSSAPSTRAEEMTVSYSEPYGMFALGLSETRGGFTEYSCRKGPAYTPLTWTNTSVGASEFEWEVMNFDTNSDEIIKTENLVRSEWYSLTAGPVLYGMDAEGNAKAFQIGAENTSDLELGQPNVEYYFGGGCDLSNGVDYGMSTYLHGNTGTGFMRVGDFAYGSKVSGVDPTTKLDPIFTDKDGFDFKDPQFKGYGNLFKKPVAPYFITKMWCWMALTVNKPTVVEMTLYPVSDEGRIDYNTVMATGSLSVSPDDELATMGFDLFVLDEDGLETDDLLVIDSAFFAVMSFKNEDVDAVYPVCGDGAVFPRGQQSPYSTNAYMLIDEGENSYLVRCPYYFGANEALTELFSLTDFMWMVDAVYPWCVAADGVSTVNLPAEGGTASFNINSYLYIQYMDYYLPEDCDWIDFDKVEITENQELGCQVLNIPVDALPEGVDGRSVEITAVGPGTELTLTLVQGEGNAVSVVVSDKNAEYYDLQGRRVANPDKGIYIKKTANKTEKVIL